MKAVAAGMNPMDLKRGVDLTYVHFHSSPATSQQSIQNVEDILIILSQYQIKCNIYMVPLLEIQQKIMSESPNKMWVILFRRAMIKLSTMIAEKIADHILGNDFLPALDLSQSYKQSA